MDKAEMAQANFLKGYNCAQSVLLAFAPECGLSEETAPNSRLPLVEASRGCAKCAAR